ncbi:hypothetical protein OIV83_001030 [Microbotryomycetes sp. JL201]|nr:hypothetical protein OIV83_001030 [Microbotryomycetes sp. JL201]
MAKRKVLSQDTVDSDDDGAVNNQESDGASSSSNSPAPPKKSKTPKAAKSSSKVKEKNADDNKKNKKNKVESDLDDDDDEDDGPSVGLEKNDEGEPFVQLPGSKRVMISKFKGKKLINIREMYEKDGEIKPGKKGIALTPEQFQVLKKSIPLIESALRSL